MAARAFWNGYLKLSLVTCAVSMTPVTSESEKIRFHTLNRATGHRVQSRFVDAASGKPVRDDDQVRAYPRADGDDVILEDDELDAVALESTRTIDIEKFVAKASIDPIWYDTPHYLAPSDKVGAEAYAVIRDAMKATAMVGISRLVLYRRERAILLDPRDKGLVLWTLRYGDEVRESGEYFAKSGQKPPDTKLMTLVKKLIAQRTQSWSTDLVEDPVQDKLADIIAAKNKPAKKSRAGAKPAAKPASNVIDLTEALRASLGKKPK